MKFLKSLAVCLLASVVMVSFSSCDKDDVLNVESPEIQSSESLQLKAAALPAPSGWKISTNGNGTRMYIKGSDVTCYVVEADLKAGAKVGMVYDAPISGRGTASAKFTRRSLSTWNTYGTFFAIANSMYFDVGEDPNCDFPFPFRQGSMMETLGTGGANVDIPRKKSTLNIYSSFANIISIGTNPMQTEPMAPEKAYAGFYGDPNIGNDLLKETGRTLVGIKDEDGDGKCEKLYLLVSSKRSQAAAYAILANEWMCSKIITFDGGGSSQLICKGIGKISSSRTIPIAIVIKEIGVN